MVMEDRVESVDTDEGKVKRETDYDDWDADANEVEVDVGSSDNTSEQVYEQASGSTANGRISIVNDIELEKKKKEKLLENLRARERSIKAAMEANQRINRALSAAKELRETQPMVASTTNLNPEGETVLNIFTPEQQLPEEVEKGRDHVRAKLGYKYAKPCFCCEVCFPEDRYRIYHDNLPPQTLVKKPVRVKCQHCYYTVNTQVSNYVGQTGWISAFLLLPLCMCWMPFFVDAFQDSEHLCPNCGMLIGRGYASPCDPEMDYQPPEDIEPIPPPRQTIRAQPKNQQQPEDDQNASTETNVRQQSSSEQGDYESSCSIENSVEIFSDEDSIANIV